MATESKDLVIRKETRTQISSPGEQCHDGVGISSLVLSEK